MASKRAPSSELTSGQSKRTKSSNGKLLKSTPTKSKYFEQKPLRNASQLGTESEFESAIVQEESGYEDEDATATSESEAGDEDDYDSEALVKAKRKGRQRSAATLKKAATPKKAAAQRVASNIEELWRPGLKTGLGPGTQVIIQKPKARAAGETPYKDDMIHPNTMLFLRDLAANNDREWLKMHDPDYRASLNDFNGFIERLTEKVVEADSTIPELPIKDLVFRIYRDIRFSPDPTPYKAYFSAAWSRTGRKGPFAAYYVQIQPGGSFVGGGLWHPEAQPVARLRDDIDRRPRRIRGILTDSRIRKEFFGGIPHNETKAIKAFVAQNAENALKTKPKGYDAAHKDIELLRLKNYTIGTKLDDSEVLGPPGFQRIAGLISCLVPFITYLNSVVMPDEPNESDQSDDEKEGARESRVISTRWDHAVPTVLADNGVFPQNIRTRRNQGVQ